MADVTVERRYRWILGRQVTAEWVRERFGLDPNRVGGLTISINPSDVVRCTVELYIEKEDLDSLPGWRTIEEMTS